MGAGSTPPRLPAWPVPPMPLASQVAQAKARGNAAFAAGDWAGAETAYSAALAACDALDALAEDPAIHLDMDFRPGDMQFVSNHWIMHSRTAYEDFPDPAQRRHLFRLWLACEDGPALPEVYTRAWQGATARGRPAGIRVPGVPLSAPLDGSW